MSKGVWTCLGPMGCVYKDSLQRGLLHTTSLYSKLLVSMCGMSLCKRSFTGQQGVVFIKGGVPLKGQSGLSVSGNSTAMHGGMERPSCQKSVASA
eukprot:6483364-Amphidinium_carterae.1